MPKRGKQMTYEERLACIHLYQAGKTDAQIAAELGWSRWVIRKWRWAYQKQGEAGLISRMGRPKNGILSSYPPDLCATLEQMRTEHPGWGPITLIEELARHPLFVGADLPSRARVAALLKTKGLARCYQRNVKLPQPLPSPAIQPHDTWQMDAQGVQVVAGLGPVAVLNILDVASRLKIESYPHVASARLDWQSYQLALRCAFVQCGLPKVISLDHDSAFFDSKCRSPYPARLHLWLLGLGIEVVFITRRPPLAHAEIERGHQTLAAQAITGQHWDSQQQLWQGLRQRREFLNCIYPSRTLQAQAPLEAFPTAVHSGRAYRPEWESDLLDLRPIYAYLTRGRWFRETNTNGEFFLGMQRYNMGIASRHKMLEIVFDPATLEFVATVVDTRQVRRFAAKGLTKNDLIGEMMPYLHMPSFQLMLPFDLETWRQIQLAQLMSDTTL